MGIGSLEKAPLLRGKGSNACKKKLVHPLTRRRQANLAGGSSEKGSRSALATGGQKKGLGEGSNPKQTYFAALNRGQRRGVLGKGETVRETNHLSRAPPAKTGFPTFKSLMSEGRMGGARQGGRRKNREKKRAKNLTSIDKDKKGERLQFEPTS